MGSLLLSACSRLREGYPDQISEQFGISRHYYHRLLLEHLLVGFQCPEQLEEIGSFRIGLGIDLRGPRFALTLDYLSFLVGMGDDVAILSVRLGSELFRLFPSQGSVLVGNSRTLCLQSPIHTPCVVLG